MSTTPISPHDVDVFLDAIRLVQAVLHGDGNAYNQVVRTTAASPSEVVFALTTILAAAAADHDDPDAAIAQLRAGFVQAAI